MSKKSSQAPVDGADQGVGAVVAVALCDTWPAGQRVRAGTVVRISPALINADFDTAEAAIEARLPECGGQILDIVVAPEEVPEPEGDGQGDDAPPAP